MRINQTGQTVGRNEAMENATLDQWKEFKNQHPEYVLFFRQGNFYELYFSDAALAKKTLGLPLYSRPLGAVPDAVPYAAMPYHEVNKHLRRMIAAGHKCAICEKTGK